MMIVKGVFWRDGGRDGGRWFLPVDFVFDWAGFIVGVVIHVYAHHRLTFYPVSMPWNVHTIHLRFSHKLPLNPRTMYLQV